MTVYTVAFDGFDGAPAGKAPYLDSFTRSVAGLIAQEHLAKPLVIGHSLGGHIALYLAETMPDAFGAVMVVDALPLFPPPQAAETHHAKRPQAPCKPGYSLRRTPPMPPKHARRRATSLAIPRTSNSSPAIRSRAKLDQPAAFRIAVDTFVDGNAK
ncbi:MAG: hypothetical protein NVSMB64_15620 [Candidatus Velthaea sp.]